MGITNYWIQRSQSGRFACKYTKYKAIKLQKLNYIMNVTQKENLEGIKKHAF